MTRLQKVTRDSIWFQGRMVAKKKLGEDLFGMLCVCGKKYRMNTEQVTTGKFPCKCRSTAIVAIQPGTVATAKDKILTSRLSKLDSVFKDEVVAIQRLLQQNQSDNATACFQKSMLALLIELIPFAEDEYRKMPKERNAYAMNSLISQARELISDLKAERDSKGLALRLSHEILNPAFISMVQNIIDANYYLKRNIDIHILPNAKQKVYASIDDTSKTIAAYMEDTYNDVRDRIVTEMAAN